MFTDSSFEEISFIKKYLPKSEIIIGVDGGTDLLFTYKIKPNLIIGDMDSINNKTVEYFRRDSEIAVFPSKKDETDTELALKWCVENNKNEIIIFNSMQKRLDHIQGLIANLIFAFKNGVNAQIVNQTQKIFIANNQVLDVKKGMLVSLIPLSEKVENITTKGLEYPLVNENLYSYRSRGISNVAVENKIMIIHKKGLLLVVITKKGSDEKEN